MWTRRVQLHGVHHVTPDQAPRPQELLLQKLTSKPELPKDDQCPHGPWIPHHIQQNSSIRLIHANLVALTYYYV
jgi:hypothetical protein